MKKNVLYILCIAVLAAMIVGAVVFAIHMQKEDDGKQTDAAAQTTASAAGETTAVAAPPAEVTSPRETEPAAQIPQETTTEAPQETVETGEPYEAGLLEYGSGDEDRLCRLLEHILGAHTDFDENGADVQGLPYNASSSDALVYALNAMIEAPYCQLTEDMEQRCGYNWSSYYTKVRFDDPDLLASFQDYDLESVFYGGEGTKYVKYDGAFFDALLRGIFNVEPDHGFVYTVTYYEGGDEHLLLFYDSGSYYATYWDGGDGAGPLVRITGLRPLGDGRYTAALDYYWTDFENEQKLASLEATVALKEIGGERVWSVYEIRAAG